MIFKTLKERCYYFRDLADYKLAPNSWYIIMLDGHSFSNKVKKRFKRPFDQDFIDAMDATAMHLCNKLQSVQFAFVQSDEISLFCKDDPERSMEWGGRLCKFQSLCASMATAKFNRIMWETRPDDDTEYEFDTKVWNVTDTNEAYAWYRFRATDCTRNSINQYSESFLSHKQRSGVNIDELKKMLADGGHDWEQLPEGWKHGRYIIKEDIEGETHKKFILHENSDGDEWWKKVIDEDI